MGEREGKSPGGCGQMPLRWWFKQLWDTNTDKGREAGQNCSPEGKQKGGTRNGRGGEKQKAPKGEEWYWLKTKRSKSLAGKPGTS